MTSPILAACYFTAKVEADGQYDRMARVLDYTAKRHCPDWTRRIDRIEPDIPEPSTKNPSHAWNTSKLDWWNDVIQESKDGDRVVVMDADMVILRPLDDIWAQPFDLAYTVRSRSSTRIPINGGLVALRISDRTKAVMQRWQAVNDGMCRVGTDHAVYHPKYQGMNQSSFGCLLETNGFEGLSMLALPCQEWNCCDWGGWTASTRVVHYKSSLRRALFSDPRALNASPVHVQNLVGLWKRLERQMLATERPLRRTA